jgi:hypothetical protein
MVLTAIVQPVVILLPKRKPLLKCVSEWQITKSYTEK